MKRHKTVETSNFLDAMFAEKACSERFDHIVVGILVVQVLFQQEPLVNYRI